jgi:hypothetical protein
MCTYLSLVTVTSLNFTTWTLTGLMTDLFAGIALFADGARSPAAIEAMPFPGGALNESSPRTGWSKGLRSVVLPGAR